MTTSDRLIESARSAFAGDGAAVVAAPFEDRLVFPDRIVIERSGADRQRFVGWDGDVLALCDENQGVCSWGLSLDGPSAGSVLVGSDLEAGTATQVYCGSVAEFVESRRWDGECRRTAVLCAQAAALDDETLARLRSTFAEATPTTTGWPALVTYRFQRDEIRIMLWSGAAQCDWCVGGPADQVRATLPELRAVSDLATSLWALDEHGAIMR